MVWFDTGNERVPPLAEQLAHERQLRKRYARELALANQKIRALEEQLAYTQRQLGKVNG